MTQVPNAMAGSLAIDDLSYERRDVRCRDIIDHAISVQESTNTMAAFEYLKSHDIGAEVIERVLLDPDRRRTIIEQ
ncbi:MAG: hypothetical protein JWQ01_2963 [Massilia sp.]|jgi:hypothetical protein|nr:hypothetical protein [Massilia sp.]